MLTYHNGVKQISSEEEQIGMCKCRRKSNTDIINQKVKGSSSEEGYIGIRKCRRKNNVEIKNEEVKGKSSEVEQI